MNILVTGAKGFVGRNLVETLKTIRDGKNRTRSLTIGEIFEYDLDTDPSLLAEFCAKADFVFNLAGVNRPQHQEEFMGMNRKDIRCGFDKFQFSFSLADKAGR